MKSSDIHVVYVITKMELGGAQKVCLTLAEQVSDNGIGASLISGTGGVLVARAKKLKSVYLIDCLKREVGVLTWWHEIKAFLYMIRIMRKLKNDHGILIVHTHSTKAGILGRWAAFFAGIKNIIHTIHGFGFNDFQPRVKKMLIIFIEYMTSLITSHFVCVSQKDREFGVNRFPKFEQKSSIIRAAAEWERFYTIGNADTFSSHEIRNRFIIGTVSCFKPQKNLFDLLTSFKIMYQRLDVERRSTVLLQIIGDGKLRCKIEEWIISNGFTEKIQLLGWQDDIAQFMKKWNIFCLSSLWEGLPIAVVEARFCKLPVVAYDVGGISEIIFNSKNGFLIPPKNIDLLTDKLVFLVENPGIASDMGQYNDELLEFTNTTMVQRHLDLYQKFSIKL